MSYKSKTKQIQNYTEIIAAHNAENPFTDPEFPTNDHSIGGLDLFDVGSPSYNKVMSHGWDKKVSWMRVQVKRNLDLVQSSS